MEIETLFRDRASQMENNGLESYLRGELLTKFLFTQNLRSLQHFLCRISELLRTSDSYVHHSTPGGNFHR